MHRSSVRPSDAKVMLVVATDDVLGHRRHSSRRRCTSKAQRSEETDASGRKCSDDDERLEVDREAAFGRGDVCFAELWGLEDSFAELCEAGSGVEAADFFLAHRVRWGFHL